MMMVVVTVMAVALHLSLTIKEERDSVKYFVANLPREAWERRMVACEK